MFLHGCLANFVEILSELVFGFEQHANRKYAEEQHWVLLKMDFGLRCLAVNRQKETNHFRGLYFEKHPKSGVRHVTHSCGLWRSQSRPWWPLSLDRPSWEGPAGLGDSTPGVAGSHIETADKGGFQYGQLAFWKEPSVKNQLWVGSKQP